MRKSLLVWSFCGILLAGIPAWVSKRASSRETDAETAFESLRLGAEQQDAIVAHALERLDRTAATTRELQGLKEELVQLKSRYERVCSALSEQEKQAEDEAKSIRDASCAAREALSVKLSSLVEQLRKELGTNMSSLERALNHQVEEAKLSTSRFERLQHIMEPDRKQMVREMVSPIARLHGASTVGSAIVIASRKSSKPGEFLTYLLTSYHVVRDILLDSSKESRATIQVTLYEESKTRSTTAELLGFDEELDLALLLLAERDPWKYVAKLAAAETEASLGRFSPVYAVGCPLGNDPVPTNGEVMSCDHIVDGQKYWMISAPSYFGNSGGGVFAGETHDLIGIFSKIYTHGRTFPTVVPHMGLLTPASSIRAWLTRESFDGILEPEKPESK